MDEAADFAARIAQRRPELAASVLERQPAQAGADLLMQLPAGVAAAALGCMMPHAATRCLSCFAPQPLAAVLAALSPTTAAGLLRPLTIGQIDALLSDTPEQVAKPLRFLLRYPQTAVGAWMQTGPFLLPRDTDVAGALELARTGSAELDRQLFVVDRQQRLCGAVAAAVLLREAPERPLDRLMQRAPFALHSRTELHAAADHPGWQQWDALPVINRERRVVGLIHHTELRRALHAGIGAARPQGEVGGSLLELLELSWQGLADLLDGALRFAPRPARRSQPERPDV